MLGGVHKLSWQEEVGRQSKNVNSYQVEDVNVSKQGGKLSKKPKTCQYSQNQFVNGPY